MSVVRTEQAGFTRKGAATRARIVAAAADLMLGRGVAGTSTGDVRDAARVSNSQLYHYFPGKTALIRAVIAYQSDQILAGQQPLLGCLDSLQALTAWRDLLLDSHRGRSCPGGCPIGSLAYELPATDPDTRAAIADGFTRWDTAIRDGLRAMHHRGELRADADPDQLAWGVLAALQGGLLLTRVMQTVTPLEAGLDTAIGYIRALST